MTKFPKRALALAALLWLSACGSGDDGPAYTTLKAATPQTLPSVPAANATLLTHTMPARNGGSTTATSLLFVPKGTAPAGGWPLVAWAHGTTTVAKASCAPSLTPTTLDGGLTDEGFTSDYATFIGSLVGAGYAVVAPDFEGLGPAANAPFAYYSSASESRSLIAAVRAARLADPAVSARWAAVGHSEGGRGVLALQNYLAEAADLDFRGTVALAPYVSIAAAVDQLGQKAAAEPANATLYTTIQNFFVAMMATAVRVDTPSLDLAALMGPDLAALMPVLQTNCIFASFGTFAQTVGARPAGTFAGWRPGWNTVPAVRDFFAANDPGASADFRLAAPTLIVQGTADVFVLEPITTALVAKLNGRTPAPTLTYRTFAGADHGTIVVQATPDVLAFLAGRLR